MTNPFALADWQAPRPPLSPRQKRRRHVAVVSAIVTVICAALVAAVLGTVAGHPGPLPAPRLSAHDPVPAERVHWIAPANCGISAATVHALVPHAKVLRAGAHGECLWANLLEERGDRFFDVHITLHHGGPGTPDNADPGTGSAVEGSDHSPVAGAMSEFAPAQLSGPDKDAGAISGLGDEAAVHELVDHWLARSEVRFRADNVTVTVQYQTDGRGRKKPGDARKFRPGALRAASDIARSLGVRARPKVTTRPQAPAAPVRTPSSLCVAVPSELRDRLVDDDGPALGYPKSCEVSGPERDVEVAIAPYATSAAAGRDYLLGYLDARAAPPAGRRDGRYFRALAGVGDEAFCEYHSADTASADARPGPPSPDRAFARAVVRVGAALVTVRYGDQRAVAEPLTKEEAVNGAYAVAVRAVNAVRP